MTDYYYDDVTGKPFKVVPYKDLVNDDIVKNEIDIDYYKFIVLYYFLCNQNKSLFKKLMNYDLLAILTIYQYFHNFIYTYKGEKYKWLIHQYTLIY